MESLNFKNGIKMKYEYKEQLLKELEEIIDSEKFFIFSWGINKTNIAKHGLSESDVLWLLENYKLDLISEFKDRIKNKIEERNANKIN